jgi:hypothetical protein
MPIRIQVQYNMLGFHSQSHLGDHELENRRPIHDIVQREIFAQDLLQCKDDRSSHQGKVLGLDSVLNVSLTEVLKVLHKGVKVRPEKGHGTVNHIHHGFGMHCKLWVLLEVFFQVKAEDCLGFWLQCEQPEEKRSLVSN